MPLKQNFLINFPFDISFLPCPWTYIYYPLVILHTCTVIWKSKGGCDHDLPESETVDHPSKREEKT